MTFEYWYVFPFAIAVCILATSSGFSGAVLFQPFFYFVLQLPVASSIATGIATETIGMTGGAYRYKKMGYLDYNVWKTLIPWVVIGVLLGFSVFMLLPSVYLKGLVGGVMLLVAGLQFYALGQSQDADNNTSIEGSKNLKKWAPLGVFAGGFSATTGTGVAEMTQPLVQFIGKIKVKRANATAIFLEASADWIITLLNLSIGNIRWDILLFSVSGVLIGSQIGPRISPYIPDRILKSIFGTGVAVIGIYYLYGLTLYLLQ
jgi:uncharacterized membrane protein YfcA